MLTFALAPSPRVEMAFSLYIIVGGVSLSLFTLCRSIFLVGKLHYAYTARKARQSPAITDETEMGPMDGAVKPLDTPVRYLVESTLAIRSSTFASLVKASEKHEQILNAGQENMPEVSVDKNGVDPGEAFIVGDEEDMGMEEKFVTGDKEMEMEFEEISLKD